MSRDDPMMLRDFWSMLQEDEPASRGHSSVDGELEPAPREHASLYRELEPVPRDDRTTFQVDAAMYWGRGEVTGTMPRYLGTEGRCPRTTMS